MFYFLEKLVLNIRNFGLIFTTIKVIKYPFTYLYRIKFDNKIKSISSTEERFNLIYRSNHWNNLESISGNGSTYVYTEKLRSELPNLFSDFNIKNILDAPCGDFNWMKEVIRSVDINYTGGDIVKPLVMRLNKKYKDSKTSFIHIDLIKDKIPRTDLMICRDCLFHLSIKDIDKVIDNFIESKTTYLLTTTHVNNNNFKNKDIVTGSFRHIDLYSAPFNFPHDPIMKIDDWLPPDNPRQMCLWSRDQIISTRQF